jgi:hypothetical protein
MNEPQYRHYWRVLYPVGSRSLAVINVIPGMCRPTSGKFRPVPAAGGRRPRLGRSRGEAADLRHARKVRV